MAGNHENPNLVGRHSKERGDIRMLALIFDFCLFGFFFFLLQFREKSFLLDSLSRHPSLSLGTFPKRIPLESYRPVKFTGHISLRSSPVQVIKDILFVCSLLKKQLPISDFPMDIK